MSKYYVKVLNNKKVTSNFNNTVTHTRGTSDYSKRRHDNVMASYTVSQKVIDDSKLHDT